MNPCPDWQFSPQCPVTPPQPPVVHHVPEPDTFALLAVALVVARIFGRRKCSAS